MKRLTLINPKEDLLKYLYSKLINKDYDYSENLIIFPGKRPAHYLRKIIAESINNSFIPPVIFSIDEFIDTLFQKVFPHFRDAQIGDILAILYKLSLNLDLLAKNYKSFDKFILIGPNLYSIFEELYIEEVSPQELKKVELPLPNNFIGERINLLYTLYKSFYDELDNKKLATRALKYRYLAQVNSNDLHLQNFKKVFFVGFYVFTKAEASFLKKLIRVHMDKIYFISHYAEDLLKKLKDDLKLKDNEIDKPSNEVLSNTLPKKIFIYNATDLQGEVKLVGNLLQKEDLNERTVLILPQPETLFPLLLTGIPDLKKGSFNISMGYPFQRTPLFGYFLTLFDTINTMDDSYVYFTTYLNFLSHPFTKSIKISNEKEILNLLIGELENSYKEGTITPFIKLEDLENTLIETLYEELKSTGALSGISIEEVKEYFKNLHNNTIKRFIHIENIGDFLYNLKEVLLFLYEKSSAKNNPYFLSHLEPLIKELDSFAKSELSSLSFENRESYFNFFKKFFSSVKRPFEGQPLKGLQILGFLETRNISFKKVFFLDLNEGIFPNLSEDYFIPLQVKKILNLPTLKDREALLHYYFRTLLSQAEEAHLFYLKNEKMERSRFLEKILWEKEKEEKEGIPESHLSYKYTLTYKNPVEIPKNSKIMEKINTSFLTPTALDDYLKCGLKFYYKYILGLKREGDKLELDKKNIGTFFHKIIEEYFENLRGKIITSEELNEKEMERLALDLFHERYGENITGKIYLIRHQILKRAKNFIEFFREKFNKHKILSIEEVIKGEIEDIKFKGIVDMILEGENKEIKLIDFKTSSNPDNYKITWKNLHVDLRDTWASSTKSLQIPLYIKLYAVNQKINVEQIQGIYVLLGRKNLDEKALYDLQGKQNLTENFTYKENLEKIFLVISNLVKELKDESRPFMPTNEPSKNCLYCDFKTICDRNWVEKRDYS